METSLILCIILGYHGLEFTMLGLIVSEYDVGWMTLYKTDDIVLA